MSSSPPRSAPAADIVPLAAAQTADTTAPTTVAPGRRPGRPRQGAALLTPAHIVAVAAALLADVGGVDALSMRSLARALGVDPMALYHHVSDRDALLVAVADHVFGDLPAPPAALSWPLRLEALAADYLARCQRYPGLVQALAQGRLDAHAPTRSMDVRLTDVLAPLALSPQTAAAVRDALVDLLHGAALAGIVATAADAEARAAASWRAGFQILVVGIGATAAHEALWAAVKPPPPLSNPDGTDPQ